MDAWEATHEAGQPIGIETLCQDHPELVEEVRRRIIALECIDRTLQSRKKDRLDLQPLKIESTVDELQYLSAGGLGEVFVGQDADLHRRVALKFMHKRLSEDEYSRSRFVLEAEVTGRLEHPGVVPLYGFGCTDDNRMFYAMRYIDGETLDDAIERYFERVDSSGPDADGAEELGVEFRSLLTNFVSVCKTIAYAHNRGIVHRDIKPANVMLGRFGETIVVDWGLAAPVMRDERFRTSGEKTLMPRTGSSGGGTSSGRGAGTPAFMSPEQASELAPTPASDIYSLGATLFKLLSGKPPVLSKSLSEIRSNLIDGKLPVLSEIRSDIPTPLQAICQKAMALHPINRYPTALELARDVERYLADEPVTAHIDTTAQRLMRLARRHRTTALSILSGLCICLLVAIVAAFGQARSAHMAREAEQEAIDAKEQVQLAKDRADLLKNRNLAMSSVFLARSIGQEIDRIWRVLEFEANSPDARRLVAAINETPIENNFVPPALQTPLQDWLERRLNENKPIVDALFMLSADGTQIARAPLPIQSQVGMNFSHRDYYTGIGHDLREGEVYPHAEPLVGKDVHMSAAYKSTLQGDQVLKVTFTVPVWDDFPGQRRRRIGVIGTSVKIGSLMDLVEHSDAWLVEMRENDLLAEPGTTDWRGLLLQHPRLFEQSGDSNYPKLTAADIDALAPLVERDNADPVDYQITDPLAAQANQRMHAAIKAITIDGRGNRPYRTQWLVVAAEGKRE